MTSRLVRGFHRLGVVLAVPTLAAAGLVTGRETWLQWRDGREIASGSYAALDVILADQAPFPHVAAYDGAATLLAIGLGCYAACRAVGWVLDGFVTPGRDP